MKRYVTLTLSLCLMCLCFSAGFGCASGPVEVHREDFPYLHTNVIDEIVYKPDPGYARQPADEPMHDTDPMRLTDKDQIRAIVFWLNETFHNREARSQPDPAFFEGDQSQATGGSLHVASVCGPVDITIHLRGAYEPQGTYATDRATRSELQSMIDDRYPDDQFYYVEAVMVECKGIYYTTYFFPKLLAPQAVTGHH